MLDMIEAHIRAEARQRAEHMLATAESKGHVMIPPAAITPRFSAEDRETVLRAAEERAISRLRLALTEMALAD